MLKNCLAVVGSVGLHRVGDQKYQKQGVFCEVREGTQDKETHTKELSFSLQRKKTQSFLYSTTIAKVMNGLALTSKSHSCAPLCVKR